MPAKRPPSARRRRQFQRDASGRVVTQPINPFTGERLYITASHAGRLETHRRWIDELVADVEDERISREEAIYRLEQRFGASRRRAPSTPVCVAAAFEAWASSLGPTAQRKARSVWKNQLALDFQHAEVWELREELLERWAKWMRLEGRAPNTIRVAWEFVKAAVRRAMRAGLVDALPWGDWKTPRATVQRAPEAASSPDELVLLVRAALAYDAERWARRRPSDLGARVAVIALCGLRQGEAAGLGWDHVDLERGTVTIAFQALDSWCIHFPGKTRPDFPVKNPKDGRPLVQRLHPQALEVLVAQREHLQAAGTYRDDGPVFPARDGGWRRNATTIKPELFKKLAARAGVPNASRWVPHSLRHSFATLELAGGGGLVATQARTGHASARQLETYVHAPRELPASAIPELAIAATTTNAIRWTKPRNQSGDKQP